MRIITQDASNKITQELRILPKVSSNWAIDAEIWSRLQWLLHWLRKPGEIRSHTERIQACIFGHRRRKKYKYLKHTLTVILSGGNASRFQVGCFIQWSFSSWNTKQKLTTNSFLIDSYEVRQLHFKNIKWKYKINNLFSEITNNYCIEAYNKASVVLCPMKLRVSRQR